MKLSDLKSYFFFKSIRPLILTMVVAILWTITYTTMNFFEDKRNAVKQTNVGITQELARLNQDIEKAKDTLVTWDRIKTQNFNMVGLRVEEAKKLLDDLHQQYLINDMQVNILTPVLRNDFKSAKTGLEYSELVISFQSYSDTEVFKIIDSLYKKMPGILMFTDISVRAQNLVINDETLELIRNGGFKDIVQVRISMVWQDFKNLKANDVTQTK